MIILCDIDGVIADLLIPWLGRYNQDYQDTLEPKDITTWRIENFVKPACGRLMLDYLADPTLYEAVLPITGALEGVTFLKKLGHQVIFVTACNSSEQAFGKLKWLFRYRFVDSPEYVGMKNIIIASRKNLVRGDILLDDRTTTLKKSIVTFPVLFTQPWNANDKYDGLRVDDWSDFGKLVEQLGE